MDIKKFSKNWLPIICGIVGVCGLIISAITLCILIAQHKAKAKLTAVVDYENWSAPRVVTADLTDLERARRESKKKDPNVLSQLKTDHNDLGTNWVLLGREPNYSAPDVEKMLCMCSITIGNKGSVSANEVKMYFSDAIIVEFYGGGIPKQNREIKDKIFYRLVDDLPGGEEIKVRVWTHCKPERKCADKLNIACDSDKASICVRVPVRWYARCMSYYPGWTIFLIVIMWVVIHTFVWFMRRRQKKPKSAILSAMTSRGT